MVSTDLPAVTTALCCVFQFGIHVERSVADLLGRAWQRSRRPTQGRQRSGRAGGRRRTALPARLLPSGDRQGGKATGSVPLQRSRTTADHTIAQAEWGVVAAGDRATRFLGLVARLA